LELFRDEHGLRTRETHATFLEGLGIRVQRIDAAECVELEPSLAPIASTVRAGILLPDDAWGDARLFSQAASRAAQSLGVEVLLGTAVCGVSAGTDRITGVRTDGGEMSAQKVIICAGALTGRLVKDLGLAVPIEPVKGYSITIDQSQLAFLPVRPVVDDVAHIAVTPLSGTLRVAGTVEFDSFNRSVRPGRVENLKRALRRLYPQIEYAGDCAAWSGFRPMSADGMPVIGETSINGLYINSGHGALGWTLACGSAKLIADIVVGRQTAHSGPFRVDRRYF
jgi:D-amino-acid dehydrogenase